MSRGKHASSAEARRARESAEAEVVAGRRKIASLTAELDDLRATLARERAENTERLRNYAALMEEGASPEVEALKRRLQTAREETSEARLDAGRSVVKFLWSRRDFKVLGPNFYPGLAQVLGLQLAEMYPRASKGNRWERRITPSKQRAQAESDTWSRANGVTLRPHS